LSLSHYNILLKDYSYFQFTWDGKSSWRLAYFPNPWIAGISAAAAQLDSWENQEELGTLSHEEVSMLMDELEYHGSIPPIRFEYSTAQYKEIAHPAAHFHIGRDSTNRWPVAIAIGPSLFTMIIAKFYYANSWARQSRFHGAVATEGCVDDLLIETAASARFVHDFSDTERRSPHFGRNLNAVANAPPKKEAGAAIRPGRIRKS